MRIITSLISDVDKQSCSLDKVKYTRRLYGYLNDKIFDIIDHQTDFVQDLQTRSTIIIGELAQIAAENMNDYTVLTDIEPLIMNIMRLLKLIAKLKQPPQI